MQFCEYGDVQMIRTGRYKLVLDLGDRTERLFDLEADPRETRDVADDPELAALREELKKRLTEHYRRFSEAGKAGARQGGPEFSNLTSPWAVRSENGRPNAQS